MTGSIARRRTAADILEHPAFAQARRVHVDAIVRIFDGNHFLIQLLGDSSRIMLSSLLSGFHAVHDDNDRTTWASLGRIQALVASWGVASPRRLNDVVARFCQTGYVDAVTSDLDRRVRIMRPTERLLAHDRAYLAGFHAFLRTMYPGEGFEWSGPGPAGPDRAVHLALRRVAFYALGTSAGFMPRHADMMSFVNQDAGYLCMMMAVQAAQEATPDAARDAESGGGAEGGLTYRGLAARLGVSRTHVRNVFTRAETLGWVECGTKGGTIRVLPALWSAFDPFVADIMSGHDTVAQIVLAGAGGAMRESA